MSTTKERGETASVELRSVTKRFDELVAVDDLSLELGRGEFFTLLGPSGCGKTTTLRMIAGFERPTEGEIRIEGEDVAQLPPHRRPTNTVFQSYALFPHLSVEDNVAFGLKRKKVAKEEIAERVARRAGAGRPGRRGETQARAALGRAAAARRAGAGAGQPAQGAAARRAARRARPEAAQGPAGRAEADPARGRDHLRLRHPRPGGGADDERPDRGDEPRPGRAGRRPRGRLRAPGDDLRRRLHRRLQPDAGDGRAAAARCGSTTGPTVSGRRPAASPPANAATRWCGRRSCGSSWAATARRSTACRASRAWSRARSISGPRRRSSSTSARTCG